MGALEHVSMGGLAEEGRGESGQRVREGKEGMGRAGVTMIRIDDEEGRGAWGGGRRRRRRGRGRDGGARKRRHGMILFAGNCVHDRDDRRAKNRQATNELIINY